MVVSEGRVLVGEKSRQPTRWEDNWFLGAALFMEVLSKVSRGMMSVVSILNGSKATWILSASFLARQE